MTRPRIQRTKPPTILQVYMDVAGDGDAVHDEYARRWREWHVSICGPRGCRIHRDPRGLAG